MNARDRFLKACRAEPLDRPPIWLMAQAGEHLPEHRQLRAQHTRKEIVQTPELALEATMQPMRRYGLDAAMLITDPLGIAEAMGQPWSARDDGVTMDFAVRTQQDLDRLNLRDLELRLSYLSPSLRLVKRELQGTRALVGYCPAPWTLAAHMIEGESSQTFTHAKTLFYEDRRLFDRLMRNVTQAAARCLQMQIAAGVDAIQIVDDLGHILAPDAFAEASVSWMRRLIASTRGAVPVIIFARNMSHLSDLLATTGASVLGVSWNARLSDVKRNLPADIALQGNLDPAILRTTPDIIAHEARRILQDMRALPGHIFNLGGDILPDTDPQNIAHLVEAVASFP